MELMAVVVGWAIGLVSGIVANWVSTKERLIRANAAILNEMDEIQFQCAWIVFKLGARHGGLTRDRMKWFAAVVRRYRGPLYDPAIIDQVKSLEAMTDAELEIFATRQRVFAQSRSVGLKELATPALDAHLVDLGGFPSEYQQIVLEAKRILHATSQEMEEARFYHRLTFDPNVVEGNREAAKANLEDSYKVIADQMEIVGNLTSRLHKFRDWDFGPYPLRSPDANLPA